MLRTSEASGWLEYAQRVHVSKVKSRLKPISKAL